MLFWRVDNCLLKHRFPNDKNLILIIGCCLVAKLHLILWDLRDCSSQAPLSVGFSRQGYWSGLPFPSPQRSFLKVFALNPFACDLKPSKFEAFLVPTLILLYKYRRHLKSLQLCLGLIYLTRWISTRTLLRNKMFVFLTFISKLEQSSDPKDYSFHYFHLTIQKQTNFLNNKRKSLKSPKHSYLKVPLERMRGSIFQVCKVLRQQQLYRNYAYGQPNLTKPAIQAFIQ